MNTDVIASGALILGALMSLLAGIAVLRFPDTMSRIHAATKPQVLGIMLLMLGVGLRIGSPGVIGMLVLIVILQFVTAPVSAHLTVRVAFRNAQGASRDTGAERATEHRVDAAADDGPAQMVQALADENAATSRWGRRGRPQSGTEVQSGAVQQSGPHPDDAADHER